jgi:hypothetical protein
MLGFRKYGKASLELEEANSKVPCLSVLLYVYVSAYPLVVDHTVGFAGQDLVCWLA